MLTSVPCAAPYVASYFLSRVLQKTSHRLSQMGFSALTKQPIRALVLFLELQAARLVAKEILVWLNERHSCSPGEWSRVRYRYLFSGEKSWNLQKQAEDTQSSVCSRTGATKTLYEYYMLRPTMHSQSQNRRQLKKDAIPCVWNQTQTRTTNRARSTAKREMRCNTYKQNHGTEYVPHDRIPPKRQHAWVVATYGKVRCCHSRHLGTEVHLSTMPRSKYIHMETNPGCLLEILPSGSRCRIHVFPDQHFQNTGSAPPPGGLYTQVH